MTLQRRPDGSARLAGAVAATGFLLLVLLQTYPLWTDPGGALPAGSADVYQNYWNLWWWRKALTEPGQSPYFTPYLFFPTGTAAALHTHSPFNMLVSLPVNLLLGPAAAYAFCVVLALWSCALGAYALVRFETGSTEAALLAGIVFAFFPQRLDFAIENLNLLAAQFLPFAVLFLRRLGRSGARRDALGLGVAWALNALADWQLGILATLALLGVAGEDLSRGSVPRGLYARRLLVAALAGAAIVLPAAAPLALELADKGLAQALKPQVPKGIDIAFLLIPQYAHPLFGSWTTPLYTRFAAYASSGFVCYLGIVPLALVALALRARSGRSALWAGLLAAGGVLALGAHPLLLGRSPEAIPLPFGLLEHVPGLNLLRVANRFLIPASLAFAVLAGLGWLALANRSRLRFAALAAAILFEYSWLPFPASPPPASPFYRTLARSPGGAVLDIPFGVGPATVQNMAAQVVHGRPIAGGYLATTQLTHGAKAAGGVASSSAGTASGAVEHDPLLADLAGLQPRLERPLDTARLRALGFEFVLLHLDRREGYRRALPPTHELLELKRRRWLGGMPDATVDRLDAALRRSCGTPAYEDAMLAAFDLRSCGRDPLGP